MSEYKPITQGLRGRLKVAALGLATPMVDGLMADCDNIDAIHAALERECAEMRGFCERVKGAVEDGEDVTLFGADYMALSVDKEDVFIHPDDELDWPDGTTLTVKGVGKDGIIFYIDHDTGLAEWTSAEGKRHHAKTVEDTLREFAKEWSYADDEEEETKTLEKFAKYLKLAGVSE